jgi:hypothetical protein
VFEYFPKKAPDLFGVTHLPSSPARAGVVILGSVRSDRPSWRSRERALGAAIAGAGLAALRFDYRGEGRSAAVALPTFTSLLGDARQALEHHQAAVGGGPVACVAIRFGALVATGLDPMPQPLLLWDPALRGDTFFLDLARARTVRAMGFEQGRPGETPLLDRVAVDVFTEEMSSSGRADLNGFIVERSLYESCGVRDLAADLGRPGSEARVFWSSPAEGAPTLSMPGVDVEYQRRGSPIDVIAAWAAGRLPGGT